MSLMNASPSFDSHKMMLGHTSIDLKEEILQLYWSKDEDGQADTESVYSEPDMADAAAAVAAELA